MIENAPVDLAKVKVGDEVTVRGFIDTVRDFEGGAQLLVKVEDWRRPANVIVSGSWSYVGVNIDQVASHTPKALEVGDRVKWALGPDGEILAIQGDFVWLKVGAGNPYTAVLSDLERVS